MDKKGDDYVIIWILDEYFPFFFSEFLDFLSQVYIVIWY